MKKILFVLIPVLIVIGAWYYLRTPAYAPSPSGSPEASVSGNMPSDEAAEEVSVSIRNFAFSPSVVTVAAGTTVTWTNEDRAPHTVTGDSGGTISSGNLQQGDSVSITFDTPGTYPYHCSIHPYMTGRVVVR